MPDDDIARSLASGTAGRPLRARGQRTRARLLAAGTEVFTEMGLHTARVDDIVRVAESSHGTFYLYFSSKEDLFEQLIGEVARELSALVDDLPVVAGTERGRTALRHWLDRFADLYEHYGAVIRTWTEAELSSDGRGHGGDDAFGGLVAGLATRVRIPKRSGLDPAVASLVLITMCERFNYYAATRQVQVTRDEMIDTLVDIIDAALFGP